ncbi:MAG: hypothetical protein V3R64_02650 [Sphingomonadales bacterium]
MKLKLILFAVVLAVAGIFIFWPDKTDDIRPGNLPGGITAHLLDPTSNNAVAGIAMGDDLYLYSFSGLGFGKETADIHSNSYLVNVSEQFATNIPEVPGTKDRLASIAATVGNLIYVIGGYTVEPDGTEISTPEVYAFDPLDETYKLRAPMPTPVDDTVALVYLDRYIYLVSGWHNEGNVTDVQVYDTLEDRWFSATDYPGSPVFGHAGGIAGNRFVIADGVAVLGKDEEGRRKFGATDEVYLGTINPDDPAEILWTPLPAHPGNPLYRMAATGVPSKNLILFAGGSDNPYNYNGMGYDGEPSGPSASVFGFDIVLKEWRVFGNKPFATMDHRGLVQLGDRFYTLGGMAENQEVIDTVSWFSLEIAHGQ